MESLHSLKRKIQSVKKTSKITEAMKLVSIVKLKRERERLLKIQDYYNEFYNVVSSIVDSIDDLKFLEHKNAKDSTLYIVINSSLGLCGAYNNNINKAILSVLKPNDQLILLGKKAFSYYKNHELGSQILNQIDLNDNQINMDEVQAIRSIILELFQNGSVNKVKLAYTKFVNAMKFEPTIVSLLPLDKELLKTKKVEKLNLAKVEFLPNEQELISALIPSYIDTFLYGALVESKVCEFASRRNAMDAATNNANDLTDKYNLKFNKLRQAKITAEIIEMMSGQNE